MQREFAMPDVGEGLTEAEIVTWNVAVGDTVVVNQILCEIETAKAAVELPSPFAGTVVALLAQPGETIAVGRPIVVIETAEPGGAAPAAAPAPPAEEGGAKIGEAGVDGRIATLVGYGPRPGSVARRPRRAPAAAGAAGAASVGPRPLPPDPRAHPLVRRPPSVRIRPRRCGPRARSRWPSRRCASSRRTWASTCARSSRRGRTASSPARTSRRS